MNAVTRRLGSLATGLTAALAIGAPAPLSAQPALRAPAPGPGDLRGLTFSADVYGLRRLDDGHHMWQSDRSWSALGLEVGYDLLRLGQSTRLAVTLGTFNEKQEPRPVASSSQIYQGGSYSGRITGELKARSLLAGAAVRWRAESALQPYATVAVGGTRSRLNLQPFGSGTLEASALGLLGRASLGLRLQPRALIAVRTTGAAMLAVAFAVEIGAFAGTALDYTLEHRGPTNETAPTVRTIPVDPVPLGALSPTAAYGRFAAIIAF